MFSKWFKKAPPAQPQAPEIMGLYLGGSFSIDKLKLRLIEPHLVIEQAASDHVIQAVGEAPLDNGGTLLRFYTDDDAFLQVVLDGGKTESHITDVKLWYFFETTTIGSDQQWRDTLRNTISQPMYALDGHEFCRVWDAVGGESPPVAVTETTFTEGQSTTQTDQFLMLYERPIEGGLTESLLVVGEEKIIGNNADRCLVTSTGFDITSSDITIIG